MLREAVSHADREVGSGRAAVPELVDARFVRDRLRIGRSTLRHMEQTGRVRAVRLNARCVRYVVADLVKLVAAG